MSTWYLQNQDYFTENFCVNKDKKELECHGRCHLQKQFGEETNNDNSQISVPVLELEFTTDETVSIPKRVLVCFVNHESVFKETDYLTPTLKTIIPPPNTI